MKRKKHDFVQYINKTYTFESMQKHKCSPMQINTYQFMFNESKRKSILHELYLNLCAFESTFPHERNTDLVPKRCLYLDIDVMFRILLRFLHI